MNLSRLKEEMGRRKSVLEACFDKQQTAIMSPFRQKAILTSRRAGKTNTVLRGMVLDAFENADVKYAYIGLSRITAENIVWKELESINDAHGLKIELQGYRLRAIFPNKSSITLYGADQPGWIKKFKGAKYREVVIDEAGEFDIDLQDFIYRVIRPTLTDMQGKLWLIGTPGIVPSGYWWQVTRPDKDNRAKGWEVHQWHSFDNPFIKEQFQNDITELGEIYGAELNDLPWFQREWLGQWSFDSEGNVYKYRPEKSDITEWEHQAGDRYILAVDPGYKDATGFLVGCFNPERSEQLTYVECFKKPAMLFDDIGDKVQEFVDRYPGIRVIGDPDSAHFLAELRTRRRINVEDAQKTKKQDAIAVMNNDFVSGRIKMLMPACKPYAEELFDLKRYRNPQDERKEGGIVVGDWKEHPKQANDLCDCGLYIHRVASTWNYREPEPKIEYGSEEYFNKIEAKLKMQARQKITADKHWWRTL